MLIKKWIQEYKNYYDFDSIYKAIYKNENLNNIIKSLNWNEDIPDKKLALMIKQLPNGIMTTFKEKDKNFTSKYKNKYAKMVDLANVEYQYENREEKIFHFYSDFEIIHPKIYDDLFKNLNRDIIYEEEKKHWYSRGESKTENKEEIAKIFFDKKRIIIKIENQINPEIKGSLYLGYIDENTLTFRPECFLLYNSPLSMTNHINAISYGFNNFCESFMKEKINTKELLIHNTKYGLAVKSARNKDWDIKYDDNDLITKYFNFAPKVGLCNIGATCYMNATLQCFCQILEFASYFKYHSHVKEVSKKYEATNQLCLTFSFKELISKIWPDSAIKDTSQKKRKFEPKEFRKKIANMSSLFENDQANDAKDLVNFIIMTLHEELNQPIINNQNNNNQIINQTDPISVFKNFHEEYINNFRSKISELFYAIQQTETTCTNCKNIQYNFQAYFFLVFPLEEVKKYAINKIIGAQGGGMNMNMNFMNNGKNMIGNNINMMNMANNMGINLMNNQINNMNMMSNNFNNMNNMSMNMNMNNNNFNIQMNNQVNDQMNRMNNQMNQVNNQMNQINNQINQINSFSMNINQNNQTNNMNMNSFNNVNNVSMNIPTIPNMNQSMNNINNMSMNNFGMLNSLTNPQNMNMNSLNIINIMPNINMNTNINNFNMNDYQKLQKLNNNIVNIYDCFEFNQKMDRFVGKDQIYCNRCQRLADANYISFLTTDPKILILLLNRGVGIQFKIKLEFTTELDISNFVNFDNKSRKYQLIGVITHLGESGASGHFIAHCKSPVDNEWYTYNDEFVSKCDNFQRNIIDLGMPYLLFYQRTD